jgi:hypothetical protein
MLPQLLDVIDTGRGLGNLHQTNKMPRIIFFRYSREPIYLFPVE